jgi:predicted nuclease with RNAse H fold
VTTTAREGVAFGIDVGADRLHIVGLSRSGEIISAQVIDPSDDRAVAAWFGSLPNQVPIAIDGPQGLSTAPFRNDETVSNKFRTARGCEVELGRQRGIWVSFVTPTVEQACAPWMKIAINIHRTAAEHGHESLETYPYAVFHTLHGARPPKKSTSAGTQFRAQLLLANGIKQVSLSMWSHDALDATAAALVAWHRSLGTAECVSDGRDNSSLWLPASSKDERDPT